MPWYPSETPIACSPSIIDWRPLSCPRLHDARGNTAIVADLSADLPSEWEAFLAPAVLAGRVHHQVKQLWALIAFRTIKTMLTGWGSR